MVVLRVDVFDFAKQLSIIPSESNADPTVDDVTALLAVLDPQTFTGSYWAQSRSFSLGATNLPYIPPNATYPQIIHALVNSNERFGLPGSPYNLTFAQWVIAYNIIAVVNGLPTITLSQIEAQLVAVPTCAQPTIVTLLEGGSVNATNRDLLRLSMPYIVNTSRYDVEFTVAGVLDEPAGKWPEVLGSIVMVENDMLIQLLQGSVRHVLNANITAIDLSACNDTQVPDTIPLPPIPVSTLLIYSGALNASTAAEQYAAIDASVDSLDGNAQSLLSIVNYKHRVSTYLKDLDSMNADLIKFTDTVALSIGLDYPATFTTPIAATLTITQYIRYFLDNIFYSVVALMVFLGVLLIFSLLLHDVDSKDVRVRHVASTRYATPYIDTGARHQSTAVCTAGYCTWTVDCVHCQHTGGWVHQRLCGHTTLVCLLSVATTAVYCCWPHHATRRQHRPHLTCTQSYTARLTRRVPPRSE